MTESSPQSDESSYDPYEEITFSSEEEEDSFHSEQRNRFKTFLRFNHLLKTNILDILPEAINAGHILHVIPKYGNNVLTVSDMEKVQIKLKNEEAVVELLNRLVLYENWFTVFLKCLADKHVNQEYLVDVLKKIEADVHNEVYRDDSKEKRGEKYVKPLQRLKNFFFKKRPASRHSDKYLKRRKYPLKKPFQRKKSSVFCHLPKKHIELPEYSGKHLELGVLKKSKLRSDPLFSSSDAFEKCPCELESVVKEIREMFNSQRKERYSEILSSLLILLNEIRNSIHGMRCFEQQFMKQNLPGLLVNISRLCVTKSLNILLLQIKQSAFKITVYLTNSSPEYCHIFLREDIIGVVLCHLHDDKMSSLHPSADDKRDTLLQIKKDSMVILLTLARIENCKNKLSTLRLWMEHNTPFSQIENKFVKDLTFLLYAYLMEKKCFLQLLAEMGTTLDESLDKLLRHLKYYTDYNHPSSRQKIEVNIYIEGMAHLASIAETSILTQADQFLTLQKIVRRIDDKTVNTAYVHLLCNIELSKLIVTERQTLQSVARVSPKRLLDPYQTDVKFTDDKGNSDERSEYISIYTEGTYSDETYSTSIFSNPYGCFSMNASSIETGYESKNSFSLWNTMESSTKPTAPPLYEAKLFGDLLQPSNTSHGLLQADVKFTDDKGNSDERPEHMSIYTEGTYSDETYSASIFNNDLDFFRLNSKETGQSDYLNLPPQSPYGCFSMNISSIETGYESKNSFSLRNTMESSTKPITPHGHLYEAKLFGDLLQPSNTSHGLLQAESTNQSYDAVSKTRTTRCVGKIPDNKMLKDATDFKEKFGKGHFYSKNKGYFYRNAGFSITKVNSATSTSFLIKAEMIYYLDYLAIIQFMDKITASGPCRTILESAPSGSLNQFFQTDCGMKCLFSDVIRLNAQITKGMTYLEGMKIVLWDLRAEKILVGDHFNIKISDFEYAVQLQNEDSIHFAELCEGIPVGWTAPEAVLEKKFSLKSDVWSFGVVMYETVTLGRTPYSGDMLLRIIKEGKFKEYPENSLVLVPDFYLNIMLECWESARKETKIPLP